MEIKLNLLEDFDVYKLYIILGNEKAKLERDNCKHKDMIKLLVGNENNVWAMQNLDHENHCIEMNNNDLEIIDNIRNQLEPLVDKVLGK